MTAALARLTAVALVVLAVAMVLQTAGSHRVSGYEVTGIFDDAAFAVQGETVRVAGSNVGSIRSLDVTPERKAAVTMQITDRRFAPFHADATCSIRPQSLIGEKYIDCEPGTAAQPALGRIGRGLGKGTYLLPLARTHSPVDSDLVQDIYREPVRQQFALIINELGTGLAARGSDLNAVIHRADPALGYTDQVIQVLAKQNKQLAQLSSDSDTVLAPLARMKSQIQGFIRTANTTSAASATRAAAEQESIRLFPGFLGQLQPLMVQLQKLADQGTPLMASLAQGAEGIDRQFKNLAPFAKAARPALISLGHYAQLSTPQLVGTTGLDVRLLRVARESLIPASLLAHLLGSFDNTGGIEQLMSFLYNGTSAANGFDSKGHYLRTEPQTTGCVAYALTPVASCTTHFADASSSAAAATAPVRALAARGAKTTATTAAKPASSGKVASGAATTTSANAALPSLLQFLVGNGK